MPKELKSETSILDPHAEWEAKREGRIHQSAPGSQLEGASDGCWLHASSNGDVLKASKHPGNNGTGNGAQCIVDMRSARDLTAPIPGRINSSSQTATNALKEAKDLRDYADRLKISGFGFESNEINFQAALKFLRGASLLETCNEAGRQGEMTQMQAYSITAKLCESPSTSASDTDKIIRQLLTRLLFLRVPFLMLLETLSLLHETTQIFFGCLTLHKM